MTMTRTPGTAPAGQGTGPERRRNGVRIAGFSIRLTTGAYILAMLAVVVSALSLRAAAPGRSASAYAAATAGVVVVLPPSGPIAAIRRACPTLPPRSRTS